MANYIVDASLLKTYLPRKTELDIWNNACYVSLVGFKFQDTRIKGFKIPFHVNFEEVNLRFYVRYRDHGKWKRGVVFVKEIVPKHALTFVANHVYGENYETMPMDHSWLPHENSLTVEYKWRKKRWNSLQIVAENNPSSVKDDTEEGFITEHYWGYTKLSHEKTSEYEVTHPKWDVYSTKSYSIDVDFGDVYGDSFAFLSDEDPASVFLAEGSTIEVKNGRAI